MNSETRELRERIRALIKRTYDDPALFNEAVLGRPPFWTRQKDMANLVVDNKSTIIISGNAVGKSWWCASLVLWYLFTRPNAIVVSTAPTHQQLANVLWRNIREAYTNSRIPLGGSITSGPTVSPQLLRVTENWLAIGLSTTSVEKMSGFHCQHLLVVCDEASGVSPEVYEAVDGLVYDKLVLIGNPLRNHGTFYELSRKAATTDGMGYLKISSLESPDIDLQSSPRGMACRGWLDEMRAKYGESSLWWKSHVLAEFPDADQDSLIPPQWLDLCDVPPVHSGPRRMALDLAMGSGGDHSVLLVRDDNSILELQRGDSWNLEEIARRAKFLSEKWSIAPHRIVWDMTGIGADFENRLMQYGLNGCHAYLGAKTSGDGGRHHNLRSACAWAMRCRLDPDRVVAPRKDGVVTKKPQFSIGPEHLAVLRPELQALRYFLDRAGRIQLETKKEIKKVLGRSPDACDSLLMSWALGD